MCSAALIAEFDAGSASKVVQLSISMGHVPLKRQQHQEESFEAPEAGVGPIRADFWGPALRQKRKLCSFQPQQGLGQVPVWLQPKPQCTFAGGKRI